MSEAIIKLRDALGYSQQSFANRMGLAITTIARYETSRPPHGAELAPFSNLAITEASTISDAGKQEALNECAKTFVEAMAKDLGLAMRQLPSTMEESLAIGVLLTVMRNRHIPQLEKGYKEVKGKLSGCFHEVGRAEEAGIPVVLLADPKARAYFKGLESGPKPDEGPLSKLARARVKSKTMKDAEGK